VHLITVFVNNQHDAQSFFLFLFIPILYMFRATKCSSSGQSVVSIRPLVYVTVCRWTSYIQTCIPHGHLHKVTYTRGRIDTVDSPDYERLVARNMYRIGINKYKKKNCASSWLFTKIVIRCTVNKTLKIIFFGFLAAQLLRLLETHVPEGYWLVTCALDVSYQLCLVIQ